MLEDNSRQSILIVDDSHENIRVLGELLRNDYDIKVANNGEKALKIAAGEQQPDLILLDVMMPVLDGYEVCRRLKSSPLTKNIPVIFITGRVAEEDEIHGFELGAVDYVTKPFNPMVVKARIKTHAELKRLRDVLELASYCDGLTGIANRRRFDQYLEISYSMAAREGFSLAVIMMDIDYFKPYNDFYGHQAGDECLKAVARKLASLVRRRTDLVARYGGEEFVCVMPGTNAKEASTFAELLRQGIEELKMPHEKSPTAEHITISLGVSGTEMAGTDIDAAELVRQADIALYKSKGSGRNRVTTYTDQIL